MLVDAGMVAQLVKEEQENFIGLFQAIGAGNGRQVRTSLICCTYYPFLLDDDNGDRTAAWGSIGRDQTNHGAGCVAYPALHKGPNMFKHPRLHARHGVSVPEMLQRVPHR